MTQTIRYYKDETTCKNCGRHIKNVVEVDGVEYGIVCCDLFIDSKSTVRKIKRSQFADLVMQQEREELKALRFALLDYAIAILPDVFGKPSPFFNKTSTDLNTWLEKHGDHKNALGVIAILQSRLIKY